MIGLLKDRASTVKEIAENAAIFYTEPVIEPEAFAQHVTDAVRPAIADLRRQLSEVEWSKEAISAAFKTTLGTHKLKMPHLAMPGTPACGGNDAYAVHRCRAHVVWP